MTVAGANPIEEVKAVIRAHEAALLSADLDAIMCHMADDEVGLAPNAPLLDGRNAVRGLYAQLLPMGRCECHHEYSGASVVGDLVVVHGVAKNTLTPPGGQPSSFPSSTYKRPARSE